MKKNFLLFTLIAVLISSSLSARRPAGAPDSMRHDMRGPGIPVYDNMSFLLERLDLTDSQLSKIADIRSSMEKELIKLGAEVASLNIDLKNLFLTTDKIDAKKVKSLIKKINNVRGKMFEIRTMNRIKMINILNREQRKELKKIMLEHPRGRSGKKRYYRK